jgi:hypothetical protein
MYVPGDNEKDPRRVSSAIRELATGRSNAVGTIALEVSPATSTVVVAKNCSALSVPFLQALSASAAASTGVYVSGVSKGQFTIAHNANAAIDRIFGFVCLG